MNLQLNPGNRLITNKRYSGNLVQRDTFPSSAQNSKQKESSDALLGSVGESYGDLATTEIYYAPFRMNPDPKNGNSWDGFLRTKRAMLLEFRVLGVDIILTVDTPDIYSSQEGDQQLCCSHQAFCWCLDQMD